MSTGHATLADALEALGWKRGQALLDDVMPPDAPLPGPHTLAERLGWLGISASVSRTVPRAWREGADGALLRLEGGRLHGEVRCLGRYHRIGDAKAGGGAWMLLRLLPDALAGRVAVDESRRRARGMVARVALLSLAINLLGLAIPFATMAVYDRVIGARGAESLWPLLSGAVLALVLMAVLRQARGRALAAEYARLSASIAAVAEGRMVRLPLLQLDRASAAGAAGRVRAARAAAELFNPANAPAIFDAPFLVLTLLAIAFVAGWLVAIPVLSLLLLLLAAWWFAALPPETDAALAQAAREREAMRTELALLGAQIGQMGAAAAWLARFARVARQAGVLAFRQQQRASALQSLGLALGTGAALATLVVGIDLVLAGLVSAGTLIGLMMLVWRITGPAQALFLAWPRLRQIPAAWARWQEVATLPGIVADAGAMAPPPAAPPMIALAGAYLRHDADAQPALAGVGCTIAAGKVTLVLGPNGAGKSTLLRLAAGLVPPQSGSVSLDGRDLRQFDPDALMAACVFLPSASDLADAEAGGGVTAALRAWEDAARRDAVLYVLDDPLPHGGPDAAARLRAFLAARRGGATIVIATHDTTLAEVADEAIVLDRGALAYAGPIKRPQATPEGPKP